MRGLVLFFALLLAVTARATESRDFIEQRAVWQDCSGAVDWETARTQAYVPYQAVLSLGYSNCVDWIRLRIAPSSEPLVLLMTPYWIDEITLYDPASPDQAQSVGDHHYLQNDAVLAALAHTLVLPTSREARDVWLRLSTTSAHRLVVHALSLNQARLKATRQLVWASLYVAVLLLLLLVLAAIWWRQRDAVLGTYLARQGCYVLYGSGYLGLPQMLLTGQVPPQILDMAFSITVAAMLPVGTLFDIVFLSHYGARKAWLKGLAAIGLLGVVVVGVLLTGHTKLALELNIGALMAGNIVVTFAAFSCRPPPAVQQLLPRKIVLGYYLFTLGTLMPALVTMLGWAATLEWVVHALILHGMVSTLMMTAILVARGQRIASQQLQMAWQLDKARQTILAEQQQREEQSRFVHMLMHELKTPLSILALALTLGFKGRREENLSDASRAIRDMKAILDRCMQADQIDALVARQMLEPLDLAALVREVMASSPDIEQRVTLTAPASLPETLGDTQLLRIIIFNLLDNAVHYGDPSAPVQVMLQTQQRDARQGLLMGVANAPGIAGWPDAARLFVKYYRARSACRASGSGLGLFLSRQLAESQGGTLVYVQDAEHRLIRFELWIPLKHD